MVIGYIRISTNKQDVENQRFEIANFAKANNLVIERWIEETVSGRKNYDKRKLGLFMEIMKPGDMIIATELTRLGRSLMMIMEILHHCLNSNVAVWTTKEGYKLGNDITSTVMAMCFGISAELERNLIAQRTREALARKKAEGVKLGRPKGALGKNTKLSPHETVIRTLIEQDNTYAEVARLFHVDRSTLKRFCDSRGIKRPISRNKNSIFSDVAGNEAISCNNVPNSPYGNVDVIRIGGAK